MAADAVEPPASGSTAWPDYFSDEALERTAALILRPTDFRQRTVETATMVGGSLRRCVKIDLSSGPGHHLVPIASPRRDALVDMITLKATSDVHATVLVRQEADIFAKRMLERRVEHLRLDPRDPKLELATSVASLSPEETIALRHLLDRYAKIAPGTPSDVAIQSADPNLLMLARDKTFMKLFRWFRGYSPLLVPCRPQTISFALEFESRSGTSQIDVRLLPRAIRSAVGLTVYDLEFPARTALFTQSYHFQYRAPSGLYIYACDVYGSSVDVQRVRGRIRSYTKRTYLPRAPAFATLAGSDADGLAHVQVGNSQLDRERPRSIAIGIKISERPLGQVFAALLRWAIVLSMIFAVDRVGAGLVREQGNLATSLLLALPGVVGLSALILAPAETVRARPIGPRVLSFLAGIASLVASVGFIHWSLSYSACARRFRPSRVHAISQHCSARAPIDVIASFDVLEICGVAVMVFLLILLFVNMARFNRAEHANPKRRSRIE